MISIKNLTKNFDNINILDNISYNFPKNGIVCLLGESGSGKTTLLNILAGFDTDFSGEIIAMGESLKQKNADELSEYRRNNIGFIFQNYNLLKGFTVSENILLASEKTSCDEFLSQLGIPEKTNEKIENLSGGQKQRVAIARALIDNPSILLADEPTGALDRKTSNEIMELFKGISKEKLVVIITHDEKITSYADEVLKIEDGKIVSKASNEECNEKTTNHLNEKNLKAQAKRNFKTRIKTYTALALAISIGIIAFVLSLSSSTLVDRYIEEFKQSNSAFNNGYIKGENNEVYDMLSENEMIKTVYRQYKLNNITLEIDGMNFDVLEKFPTAKSSAEFSYGNMPSENEIALSPSLAKKMSDNISDLIGKTVTLAHNDKTYELEISGIFNASYDDFITDFETEMAMYEDLSTDEYYSLSYDVKEIFDVITINELLLANNIQSINSATEIATMQTTFDNIQRLFILISLIVLVVSLLITFIMLSKIQNSRYNEIGLLSALGFKKQNIASMINTESMLLSSLSAGISLVIMTIIMIGSTVLNFEVTVNILQALSCFVIIFISVFLISNMVSRGLINTEPAVALKK